MQTFGSKGSDKMFINFDFNDFERVEPETYNVEIKTGNAIQKQTLTTLPDMAKIQFIQLFQQVMKSQQPIRVRFFQIEKVWNEYRNEWNELENGVQFATKSYMNMFPDEFEEVEEND